MRPVLGLAFLATTASAVVEDKPRLVLDAPRVQMLLPGLAAKGYGKRVEVTARLEGDADDPEAYYCLDEIWDWGDGTESVHENDCDPYEEGKEIVRSFTDAHHYRPGGYAITLRLVRRDKTVVKGIIDVQVH
jgi:hypothetical protein